MNEKGVEYFVMSNNISDNTRVIINEEKLRNHEIRIVKLEDSVVSLSKLETILEMQIKLDEKQQAQSERQNLHSERMFNAINQSLTKLNDSTERLKEDTERVQQEADEKIEAVRIKVENDIDRRKIDTSDWGMKVFYWVIMAISTMALAWAMAKTGLN